MQLVRRHRCTLEQLEVRRLLSAGVDAGDGAALPRAMTPAEREWLKNNPWDQQPGLSAPTAPPTGTIDPVAEYEEMEALVVSWIGASQWFQHLGQIAVHDRRKGNPDARRKGGARSPGVIATCGTARSPCGSGR